MSQQVARIQQLLRLDLETGLLYWRESRGRVSAGAVAGVVTKLGYRHVRVDGRIYRASHLVWLLTWGEWPRNEIDHINRDPGDDRPVNLADATRKENAANRGVQKNNTTGYPGIRKHNGKFEVTKNKKYIGRFDSIEQALEARTW